VKPALTTPTSAGTFLAAVLTCAFASLTFAGAVTMLALTVFVLVGVVVGALAARLGRGHGRWWRGAIIGSTVGLAWAEFVNVIGGDFNGPIAKSTFTAAAATAFAVMLLESVSPAMFLIPVSSIVLAAMILGAGGEVAPPTLAAVVSAVVTLGLVEKERRRWVSPVSILMSTVALCTGLVLVALAVMLTQQAVHPGPGTVADANSVDPAIIPPWQIIPGGNVTPTPSPSPSPTTNPTTSPNTSPSSSPTSSPTTSPTTSPSSSPSTSPSSSASASPPPPPPPPVEQQRIPWWVWVLLVIALILIVLAFLWWRRRRRWALLRRRLSSGSPRQRTIGAWLWTRSRLEHRRVPLEGDVSPDALDDYQFSYAVSGTVATELRSLARLTTRAAFDSTPITDEDADEAWQHADQALELLREAQRGRQPQHV